MPCVAYAVQDTGLNESQILRAGIRDPWTGQPIDDLSGLAACPGCDLEATGLNLANGRLYGINGGDATSTAPLPTEGDLFEINRKDGSFTIIGSTGTGGAAEIVSASFRPTDQTLWAFQETVGLLTVDVTDASTMLQFSVVGEIDQTGTAVGDNWEGLAWDLDGEFVYGAQNTSLYRFNPATAQVLRICDNLGLPGGMVEALEFSTTGTLIGSRHAQANRTLISIDFPDNPAQFSPNACDVDAVELPAGPLVNDVESITFETCGTLPISCNLGRPKALVFEYTGESCAATNNNQNGWLSCWGNPNGAQPIRVKPWSLGDDRGAERPDDRGRAAVRRRGHRLQAEAG